MSDRLLFVVLLISSEVVAALIFWLLSKVNDKGGKNIIDPISVIKGLSERFFIAFTLSINLPQSLTLFAALKIATRIKDDNKVSNDFYLLGNILSVILGIIYWRLYDNLFL